jgi:hypothetical protein
MDALTYPVPSPDVKQPSAPPTNGRGRPSASSAWPPLKITGQNLAKGRRTKAQRINLAEALHAGKVEVTKPTLKLSAVMAGVSPADIYRARKPKRKPPSLAEHLANSSPAERIEAARALGVDVVWDTMIVPIVAEDRPSPVVKGRPPIVVKTAA